VEDDVYERVEAGGLSVDEPYLICKDAERLIAFLQDAFGGVLLRRFDRRDGSLMHAEVGIDDGVVMIVGGMTEFHTAGTHKLVLHYRCREPARRDVRRYHKKAYCEYHSLGDLFAAGNSSSRAADRTCLQPIAMYANGTSRYLVAMRNLVAIRDIADIDQATPINLDL